MEYLYAKYNRERLPKFQIETILYKENDVLCIRKSSLTKEADDHIRDIFKNYILLKEYLYTDNIVEPKYCESNNTVCFDYIEGSTLEQLLLEAAVDRDREKFYRILNEHRELINSIGKTEIKVFKPSKKFVEIFGIADSSINRAQPCINIALIDFILNNLIKTPGGAIYVIDYEWVFECEIPLSFIAFRSINEFLGRFSDYLENFISADEIFNFYGISDDEQALYREMEAKFQSYVFGEGMPYRIAPRYEKGRESIKDIYEALNTYSEIIQAQSARIVELDSWGKRLDVEIAKRDESIRAQNETIAELTRKLAIVENEKLLCEQKNKEIEATHEKVLAIEEDHIRQLAECRNELSKIHNSRGWKLLNILYRLENLILPLHSRRRKILKTIFHVPRNIIRALRHVNKENVKKFVKYIRTENPRQVARRIKNYLDRYKPVRNIELKLYRTDQEYVEICFQRTDSPLVSIILPVYNQWDYTYSCLKSIYDNSEGIEYEVIIADDVSVDETQHISSYVKNVKVIRNRKNLGFLLNCNNAAKHARGKYILFLNNDTNVQKDWLKYLVDLIEKDEKIGMVGSKLVFPDGRLQEAGGIIWNDASGWNYGRLDDPEKPEYNYVKEVDYISGACIMIRSDLWKQIGGFDERFAPAYYEDSDLAFEVRRQGYKVMYQPKSVVVHFEGISNGKDVSEGLKSYQVINQECFFEKWKDELTRNHFPNGQDVFLARDRSAAKKRILVVDHYVPHHDRDAGGKCTFMYLNLFVKMGMKVTFIGDNFYPHEPYTTELKQLGIEVLHGNYYANWEKWIKENGKYYDYIYLNRPHISIKYIDLVRAYSKAKVIYFGHDLHYLREYRAYEISGDKKLLESSKEWKKKEYELFGKADVIHVVGSYEQQVLQKEFPEKPIRNIPVYFYDKVKSTAPIRFEERKDIMFIGGFGHAPNIDAVLWFASEIYPRVLKVYPDMKWYVIGSNPPQEVLDLRCKNIIVTGFISDEELCKFYESCRMSVVPLRYGAGVKGKVIESVYHRIPLITTSIGAEGLSLEENAFFVADTADDFAEKIISCYNNFGCLEKSSNNCVAFIENYFTINKAQQVIAMDIKL